MKTFKEECKTLREELKDEYKTLKEELKDEYITLRKGFNGLREGMEDVETEFRYIRYRILPPTQTQMSMSQSITYEDEKECKFEPNQQEVTKVITNIDRAISCEITYPSTEDFSDKTSRTYKVERNSTSKSQEVNLQDLQKVELHTEVIQEVSVRFLEDRRLIQRREVQNFRKLKKNTHRNNDYH
jgi:hypothetical protein